MSADSVRLPLVARRARAVADVEANPARAVTCRIATAQTLAGIIGAIDVFLLLRFVLPLPAGGGDTTANLIAALVYVPIASAAASWWGVRNARRTSAFMAAGREPTLEERRRVLREPLHCATIDAVVWGVGAVVFFFVNLPASAELAGYVASTIVMGGLTMSALGYLLTERLRWPVTAAALAGGPPMRPVGPGVKGRLLLAYAFATGIPLLGLLWVGVDVLVERPVSADRVAVTMLALGGVALVVGLTATVLVAKSLAEPLTAMRRAIGRVEAGDLSAELPVTDGSEVGLLQSGFNRMASGLRERERLRDVFSKHVGEDVAEHALSREAADFRGETRQAAVLFVDLIGSTSMAASRPPTEVVAALNRFFATVVAVVGRHGGWVNKFEGDAALVIFGCPADHDDCAGAALAAARELSTKLPLEAPGMRAGIGVSAGTVVAGNVGAEHRYEYTVIGDPVNEAARLCELAKRRPERALASEAVLRAASERDGRWRLADAVELRGRSTPTRLVVPA